MRQCSGMSREVRGRDGARRVSPNRLTSSSAMPFVVATEAHAIPEHPPLSLAAGEVVTVGRRDRDWPAFVFVTTAPGSGWVPSRYLSADTGRAVMGTAYNTTELTTRSGEILEVIDRDDESGCLWCRRTDGRAGWVPSRSLEAASVPRAPDPTLRPSSGNPSAEQSAGPACGNVTEGLELPGKTTFVCA